MNKDHNFIHPQLPPAIPSHLISCLFRKYNDLMQLNTSVLDALEMYNNLMHDQPTYGYPRPVQGTPGKMGMPQMYDMSGQQMAPQMPQVRIRQYSDVWNSENSNKNC